MVMFCYDCLVLCSEALMALPVFKQESLDKGYKIIVINDNKYKKIHPFYLTLSKLMVTVGNLLVDHCC